MEELKACPFCGVKELFNYHDLQATSCGNKDCDFRYIPILISEWQKRPQEEALQKQVDELEKTIESNNKATRIIYDKSEKMEAELQAKIALLNESLDLKEAVYASLLADYMALKAKLSHWRTFG